MSKSKLPERVQRVKSALARDPSDPRFEIAQKLIDETPDHISMWETLERHEMESDDFWVWAFIEVALNASTLPLYHYMSKADRNNLSNRIESLSKELSRALKSNDLDAHIIFSDGKVFNGFYIFEDFGESNQERITDAGTKKLKISEVLEFIVERSKTAIAEEPIPGKAGKNSEAIKFIRIMVERNRRSYGTPLNQVVATAANLIFDTQYSTSDITKLITR